MLERIRVEEGYLNKLDIAFASGLNVLIGPRGVGKTSVIELIRFALGLDAFTEAAGAAARQHALSVLGAGRVTLTLHVGGQQVLVSRTAEDDTPRYAGELPSVVVIAQNEIEAIGLSASGRLRLVDQFRAPEPESDIGNIRAHLRSVTAQVGSIARDLATARDRESRLAATPSQLEIAEDRLTAMLNSIEASTEQRAQLDELSRRGSQLAVQYEALERASGALGSWSLNLDDVVANAPTLDGGSDDSSTDILVSVRNTLSESVASLQKISLRVRRELRGLAKTRDDLQLERLNLDEKSREVRLVLDDLREGSGVLTKQVSSLRESVAQLSAVQTRLETLQAKLDEARNDRRSLYRRLETARALRFHHRKQAAAHLNEELGPAIRVTVEGGGNLSGYHQSILAALQGSGLHASSLATALSTSLSPLELVEAAESLDVDRVSTAAGIPKDRAVRALQHLAGSNLGELVAAGIDDAADLSLLDGPEYKPADELSTGQRCTVVLPILMAAPNRTLVVDQPEDHLDNAFIAATLIKALRARSQDSQYIFSTHNANIPVLGEADRIFVLGSDGKRGFVTTAGDLDDRKIADSITTVMEGGREAFRARAAYYEDLDHRPL